MYLSLKYIQNIGFIMEIHNNIIKCKFHENFAIKLNSTPEIFHIFLAKDNAVCLPCTYVCMHLFSTIGIFIKKENTISHEPIHYS